jgi:murein DD-endopeptidase MepM/ murein hydrolase activator NlpD
VVIDHQNSYQTTYGHLSKITVVKGQKVLITEAIGMVGSTGASIGNHVHYEIRKNGVLCNPMGYLLLFYSVYR